MQQAECSVRKTDAFFKELKRQDRYDSATIVLHTDTGSQRPFRSSHQDNEGVEILGMPKSSMLAMVQALLMIKRPRAQGP